METTMRDGGRRRSLWKGPAVVAALLLLIPLMGNYFVEGWNWRPGGFIVVGILMFGTGLIYQLVTRNMDTIAYRAAVGIALVTSFGLVWGNFVQAADEVNPAALMYLAVPFVGILGAAVARFRPNGMAIALLAVAAAQVLVLAIAWGRNPPMASWSAAVWRGFGGNALFSLLFIGSALLFRKSGRRDDPSGAV